jgi:Putative  PD-(D/E)XK family member, (DUF4420)
VTDVAEHFSLLEAETRRASGTQLWTRPLGIKVAGRDILVAIDSARQKHLLIPLAVDEVEQDNASQGVTLGPRVLRVGTSDITYADLHCRITSLDRVFEELVADVLGRLTAEHSEPDATCHKVLNEWRALLRVSGQGISRETIVGLVGELEVLRLLAEEDPTKALDSWQGPTMSLHDFVRGGAELEVKTTTSVDGNFIAISNIDQLDPTLVGSLHVVVVHAREDPRAPSLDERVDGLVALGMPRSVLLTKVASTGYVYGSGTATGDRFRIRSVRAWMVGDSFPGLRRGELDEARLRGVSRLRYELALDSAPKRLSDEEFRHFIATWGGD